MNRDETQPSTPLYYVREIRREDIPDEIKLYGGTQGHFRAKDAENCRGNELYTTEMSEKCNNR